MSIIFYYTWMVFGHSELVQFTHDPEEIFAGLRFQNASTMLVTSNILGTTVACALGKKSIEIKN